MINEISVEALKNMSEELDDIILYIRDKVNDAHNSNELSSADATKAVCSIKKAKLHLAYAINLLANKSSQE